MAQTNNLLAALSPGTAQVDSGYAWMRLFAAMLITTVGSAGMYISMVSVPAYQAEFGISRGAAALPFTMVMLGFGVGGVLIGRFVDRHGINRPLLVCAVALAASFLLASLAQNFWTFALAHTALGAFGCAAVFSPLLADISGWFDRRRGFAIALCASGNYIAGTIWPPLMQNLIASQGWRSTYELFGYISLAGMLPLLLVLRKTPEGGPVEVAGGGSIGSASMLGLSSRGMVWLLCVAGVGCCTAMAMPQAHVVALAVDYGLTAADGARMLSLMFGFGIISRLLFGWLSDRLGGLITLFAGSTLQCIALIMFLPADTLFALNLASALFGLFQGGIVPTYALIVREYFPGERAGSYTGIVVFATLIGMAFGGWISGAIFDWMGSYQVAFLHGIGWNLVNMLVIGFLCLRARQQRNSYV